MSASNKVSQLQNKIIQIKKELSEINKGETPLPEFIDTTNMLRSNEYLQKANEVKSTLLTAYEDYTNELENLISTVSKIRGNIASLKSRIKTRKKPIKKVKKRTVKRKTKPKSRRKTKSKTRRRKSRKSRR